MTSTYKKQFEINLTELEVIEKALREQARHLGEAMLDQRLNEQKREVATSALSMRMREIQGVLGNLHNQKIWYRPDAHVPLG